tara:strand:- start:1466 stop:2200 length:735 start_codon:yes stop_codon:yes gene_type:complete
MALAEDYKKLVNKWLNKTHTIGSPILDALIDIERFTGTSRQEIDMVVGNYFTSSIARDGRPIDGIPTYIVVDTSSDFYQILEELTISVDYQNAGDGNVNVKTEFYAMDSTRSSVTVTGGTPTNIGVPLNLDFVNVLSAAEFLFDATVTINSGVPDFTIYSSQYYKDSSGNMETVTGLKPSFFDKGRKLIMSPGKRYVFRTTSSGTATGTVDSLAQFSFTQKPTDGVIPPPSVGEFTDEFTTEFT